MPRKFLHHQSGFSNGQVSEDLVGSSSKELHDSAALDIKNFNLHNGSSLSKRSGFKFDRKVVLNRFGTTLELGANDTLKFFLIGSQRFIICKFGVFEETADDYRYVELEYARSPYYPFGRVVSQFGEDIRAIYTLTYNESTRVQNAGNFVMITTGGVAPIFIIKDKTGDKFVIVSLKHFNAFLKSFTGSSSGPIFANREIELNSLQKSEPFVVGKPVVARGFASNKLFNFYSLGSNSCLVYISGGLGRIGFPIPGADTRLITAETTGKSFILILSNGTLEYRYRIDRSNQIEATIEQSGLPTTFLYSYRVSGLNSASNLQTFNRLYNEPDTGRPRVEDDNGATPKGLDPDSGYKARYFESEWYDGNYPDVVSLENRLMFAKGNQVWASDTEDVTSFFDYDFFINKSETTARATAPKSLEYNQFRSLDESIIHIQKASDSIFIFTDKNIYKVDEDIFQLESFTYLSNESVLKGGNVLTVDSSLYLLNRIGELIRLVYNFNESAFNIINLSKKLFVDDTIAFNSIYLSDKYSNYIFAQDKSGKIFVLYVENGAKIASWSHIDYGEIDDFQVDEDLIVIKNKDEIYTLDYLDRGVPVDSWSAFTVNPNRYKNLLELDQTFNVYASTRDLSIIFAFPVTGGVADYSIGLRVKLLDGRYVLEGSKSVTQGNFIVGERVTSSIKLLPVPVLDTEGDSYYQYKTVDTISIRTKGRHGLEVLVNQVSVNSKSQLQVNPSSGPIQEFVGYPVNERELIIDIIHNRFSHIKVFGVSVLGFVK